MVDHGKNRTHWTAQEKLRTDVVAVDALQFGPLKTVSFVVLVGPSGCGKTTTLRMIAGFEDPTAGEIVMNGRVVNELPPGDRNLGMVFQSHALFPHKTVAENIEFGPRMKKGPAEERRQLVRKVAEHGARRPPPRQASGRVFRRRGTARCPRPHADHQSRHLSCSTSRFRASTPSCAANCAPKPTGCTRNCRRPSSTSPTIRKKR